MPHRQCKGQRLRGPDGAREYIDQVGNVEHADVALADAVADCGSNQ